MKKKKKEQIILPDYSDSDFINGRQVLELAELVLKKIKEQIGSCVLFAIYKHGDEYRIAEICIDNIVFNSDSYDAEYVNQFRFKKNNELYSYNCYGFYKDKEIAQTVCDKFNIHCIQANIENYKKKLDALNPIKVMEDAENQRKSLLEKYEQEKAKLDRIMKNSGEVNSND